MVHDETSAMAVGAKRVDGDETRAERSEGLVNQRIFCSKRESRYVDMGCASLDRLP